jgi:hypothetical protein
MISATTRAPSVILPDALYTRRGKIVASGISETRFRLAKKRGIEVPEICVGRRKYFRGCDLIKFIEKLAAVEAAEAADAADKQ